MSAAGKIVKTEDNYIVVTSPRFGIRESAVHYHIHENWSKYVKFIAKSPNAMSIYEPPMQGAIYIDLKPGQHDLWAYLPSEIHNQFATYQSKERHVRIDQKFGARDSQAAKKKLWYQWHVTERFFLDMAEKVEVVVHVYFHYSTCTGVFVKFAGENIDVTQQMETYAKRNAQDGMEIMLHIIGEMQQEKEKARVKLEEGLQKFHNYDLKHISDEALDGALDILREINKKWSRYLEDTIDKRFENLETYVTEFRDKMQSAVIEDAKPAEINNTEKFAVAVNSSASSVKKSKRKHAKKPNTEQLSREKSNPQDAEVEKLNLRFAKLRIRAETVETASDALKFFAELQTLKFDLTCFYITAKTGTQAELKSTTLLKLMPILPDLYAIFKKLIVDDKISEAIALFPEAQAYIPASFYYGLIQNCSSESHTADQEDALIKLFEFLYENSQDYKMLLSVLHSITALFVAQDGTRVAVSSFINMPIVKGHKKSRLFALLAEQNGMPDWVGYNEGLKSAYLLYVFCSQSADASMDNFITALLNNKPALETPHPFAQGLLCNEVDEEERSRTKNLLSSTQPVMQKAKKGTVTEAEIVKCYMYNLGPVLFCGSALAVYCEAPYRNRDILKKLSEDTSTLGLIYAFANFTYNGSGYLVQFSQHEKFGIALKASLPFIFNNSNTKNLGKTKTFSFIFCNEKEQAFADMLIVFTELDKRLKGLTTEQVNTLFGQLAENRNIYIQAGNQSLRALSANLAILLLAAYAEATIENHAIVLEGFLKASDIYKNSQDIFQDSAERMRNATFQYRHACDFARYSIHTNVLVDNQLLKAAKEVYEKVTPIKHTFKF